VRVPTISLVLTLGALAVSSCTSHQAIRPVSASGIEGVFTIQGGPPPPTGVIQRVEPLAGAPIEVRHPHVTDAVAKTTTDGHGRFHVAVAAGSYEVVGFTDRGCNGDALVAVAMDRVASVELVCPIP
jgi:hypothetical protein